MKREHILLSAEEREELLLQVLLTKQKTAFEMSNMYEDRGNANKVRQYMEAALICSQIIDMLTSDDDLIDYAEIYDIQVNNK